MTAGRTGLRVSAFLLFQIRKATMLRMMTKPIVNPMMGPRILPGFSWGGGVEKGSAMVVRARRVLPDQRGIMRSRPIIAASDSANPITIQIRAMGSFCCAFAAIIFLRLQSDESLL